MESLFWANGSRNQRYMHTEFESLGQTTDKVLHHGYQRFYPLELEALRNKKIGMFEIGISPTNSLLLWKDYFPTAHVYGIDVNCSYSDDRCTIFQCDQTDPSALRSVAERLNREFPILFINDDGTHIPEHQISTFDYFFRDVLQPGGVYIIEDVETSYWKRGACYGYQTQYGLRHDKSVIERFKLIVDYLNREFMTESDRRRIAEETSFLSEGTKSEISSVRFAHNCIIIRKKFEYEHAYDDRQYRFQHFV